MNRGILYATDRTNERTGVQHGCRRRRRRRRAVSGTPYSVGSGSGHLPRGWTGEDCISAMHDIFDSALASMGAGINQNNDITFRTPPSLQAIPSYPSCPSYPSSPGPCARTSC